VCVRSVRYVLVKFYIYIYIYLGSTRVLALCSQVLLLPPQNDEGENLYCKALSNKFLCNCSFVRMQNPPVIFKNTEHGNMTNIRLDNPLQPAPILEVQNNSSYRNRTYPRTYPKFENVRQNRVNIATHARYRPIPANPGQPHKGARSDHASENLRPLRPTPCHCQ